MKFKHSLFQLEKACPGRLKSFTRFTFIFSVLLTGCLPTNGNFTRSKSALAKPSSSTTAVAEQDGAQGVCTSLDPSSPDRKSCIACYDELLATKCPGKTTPESCADRTVANNFSNLVNQCLATAIQSGFVCTKTCPTGQVLNASVCACETPSSGTGANIIIDRGERDYGPPIVSLYVPESTSSAAGASCIANVRPQFYVRNRGETTSRFNIYRYLSPVSTNCTAPIMPLATEADILSANSPSFNSSTQSIQSSLQVSNPLDALAVAEVLGSAESTIQTYTTNLVPGTYELSINLFLFNDWKGNIQQISPAISPDFFDVRISAQTLSSGAVIAEKILFKQTFSNDPIDPALAATPLYEQSYRPRASVSGRTMQEYDMNTAAGYLDSQYMLHMTFVQPDDGSAGVARPITFKYGGTNGAAVPVSNGKLFRATLRIKPIQTCAAKYSFTDSNNLASHYCYRFTPRTLKSIIPDPDTMAGPTATVIENTCYAVPLSQRYWSAVDAADDCL